MEIVDRRAPSVSQTDDVLIEVAAVGVCGSDLQILADPPRAPSVPGVILGHEITGRVANTAPGAEALIKVGQTVVVRPNCPISRLQR
jgi:threonine dehydrogenase-like Zn-dependent dehydrogenase